jgi:hypothetical protein
LKPLHKQRQTLRLPPLPLLKPPLHLLKKWPPKKLLLSLQQNKPV